MSGDASPRDGAAGAAVPPDRCPLCSGGNACALAAGANPSSPCWCVDVVFDAELLDRVPPAARGRACICAACAGAARNRD